MLFSPTFLLFSSIFLSPFLRLSLSHAESTFRCRSYYLQIWLPSKKENANICKIDFPVLCTFTLFNADFCTFLQSLRSEQRMNLLRSLVMLIVIYNPFYSNALGDLLLLHIRRIRFCPWGTNSSSDLSLVSLPSYSSLSLIK